MSELSLDQYLEEIDALKKQLESYGLSSDRKLANLRSAQNYASELHLALEEIEETCGVKIIGSLSKVIKIKRIAHNALEGTLPTKKVKKKKMPNAKL